MTPRDDRNDTSLERELERLLTVDPSPAFEATIRARVVRDAAAAVKPGWRLPGLGLAASLAGAVVLVITVGSLHHATAPAGAREGASVMSRTPVTVPSPHAVPVGEPPVDHRAGRLSKPPAEAADHAAPTFEIPSSPAFGEVLISRDEADGLRALIIAVNTGQFERVEERQSLFPARNGSEDFAGIRKPDPIVVLPLDIAPMRRATSETRTEGETE